MGELIATCPPTALQLVSILISGVEGRKERLAEDSMKAPKTLSERNLGLAEHSCVRKAYGHGVSRVGLDLGVQYINWS